MNHRATAVRTSTSRQNAANRSDRDAVQRLAEQNPGLLAQKLAQSPSLARELSNFNYLMECLLKGGQEEWLRTLAVSKQLHKGQRQFIANMLFARGKLFSFE